MAEAFEYYNYGAHVGSLGLGLTLARREDGTSTGAVNRLGKLASCGERAAAMRKVGDQWITRRRELESQLALALARCPVPVLVLDQLD